MVPRLVNGGIAEAVVSTEVDDAHGQILEGLADGHRMAMRQTDEYEITVPADGLDVLHAFQLHVVQASQMRVERCNGLSRMALRCDMHHLCLRMAV